MEEFDFTEEEIREQLENLGYSNVPSQRLQEFKRDLEQLVKAERSASSSWSTLIEGTSTDSEATQEHPDAYSLPDLRAMPAAPVTKDGNGLPPKNGIAKTVCSVHLPSMQLEPDSPLHVHRGHADQELSRPGSAANRDSDSSLMNSSCTSEQRYMKRRVLRKKDGKSQVTDELTPSELGDMSSLEERLKQLDIPLDGIRSADQGCRARPNAPSSATYQHRPQSVCSSVPSFRLPEDYSGLKALIRPMSGNPNTRNIKKFDPVNQYQKYNQSWKNQRAPGEKSHKHLRWGVREQMLYHDEVVQKKDHKIYMPNHYIIPSDKKRKNLRWQIRQDMAAGIIPPSLFD